MIDRLAEIIPIAQKRQQQVNEKYIASKNKKYIEITEFPVNSYVLLAYPPTNLKKGRSAKLNYDESGGSL